MGVQEDNIAEASWVAQEAGFTTSASEIRRLFWGTPNPYLILRPNSPRFTIVEVNDLYLHVTGTERSEIIGRGLFEVFPDNPDDPAATGVNDLRTSLDHVIQNRKPDFMGIQKYDVPRRGPGESGFEVKYWSPVNTPVFDDAGALTAIIHRVEDVTEYVVLREQSSQEAARIERVEARAAQMEAEVLKASHEMKASNRQLRAANEALATRERELAELNARLKELDRVKSEFFSNVSHEFRTPLTLMLGPIEEVLTQPELLPESRLRLEIAHRNTLRLFKLVNNLLDFSRIEAGRVQATYQPTDLSAATVVLASMFDSVIEKAGLKFRVDCASLNEPVYVDRDMWDKIVLNLLSNAFKHTFAGEILVRLRRVDKHVELTVQDTGVGVPQDQLSHLFERFYRVRNTRARTHEGSGIGLALVHELVKLHGGDIAVTSTVNRGTTFIISIPTGKAHLPQEAIQETPYSSATALIKSQPFVEEALRWLPEEDHRAVPENPPEQSVSDPETAWYKTVDGQKVRIIIADDNADMRAYMHSLLAPYCTVEVVSDGEAAFAAARRDPPDLILSDIMMPKMDGFQLLSTLRQDPALKTVPVILLSARAGEEASVEGLSAGADDYLTKPFGARDLLARVKANLNLELHRARQAAEAAQRESEERFRSLFNQAAAGIALTNLNGGFLLVNQRYCNMVGRNRETLLQLRLQDMAEPDRRLEPPAWISHALETATSFEVEERYFLPDGSAIWVRNDVSLIRDRLGNPQAVLTVSQDMTDRKKMEQELITAKELAESANQKKSQFLSNMSHELRTPLNAVIGYSEMMLGGMAVTPEKQEQYAKNIAVSGHHLLDIVNDILDVAKIEAGNVSITFQPVPLIPLVEELKNMVRTLAEKKKIHLTFEIQPGVETIPADPGRLRQIFLNLLSNAIKFNRVGGTVAVRIYATDDWASLVSEIRDNGIGIPQDKMSQLFTEFFQVENSFARRYEGTGLGLALTKQLVELHGGSISVESEEGQGTKFTLKLPLHTAPAAT